MKFNFNKILSISIFSISLITLITVPIVKTSNSISYVEPVESTTATSNSNQINQSPDTYENIVNNVSACVYNGFNYYIESGNGGYTPENVGTLWIDSQPYFSHVKPGEEFSYVGSVTNQSIATGWGPDTYDHYNTYMAYDNTLRTAVNFDYLADGSTVANTELINWCNNYKDYSSDTSNGISQVQSYANFVPTPISIPVGTSSGEKVYTWYYEAPNAQTPTVLHEVYARPGSVIPYIRLAMTFDYYHYKYSGFYDSRTVDAKGTYIKPIFKDIQLPGFSGAQPTVINKEYSELYIDFSIQYFPLRYFDLTQQKELYYYPQANATNSSTTPYLINPIVAVTSITTGGAVSSTIQPITVGDYGKGQTTSVRVQSNAFVQGQYYEFLFTTAENYLTESNNYDIVKTEVLFDYPTDHQNWPYNATFFNYNTTIDPSDGAASANSINISWTTPTGTPSSEVYFKFTASSGYGASQSFIESNNGPHQVECKIGETTVAITQTCGGFVHDTTYNVSVSPTKDQLHPNTTTANDVVTTGSALIPGTNVSYTYDNTQITFSLYWRDDLVPFSLDYNEGLYFDLFDSDGNSYFGSDEMNPVYTSDFNELVQTGGRFWTWTYNFQNGGLVDGDGIETGKYTFKFSSKGSNWDSSTNNTVIVDVVIDQGGIEVFRQYTPTTTISGGQIEYSVENQYLKDGNYYWKIYNLNNPMEHYSSASPVTIKPTAQGSYGYIDIPEYSLEPGQTYVVELYFDSAYTTKANATTFTTQPGVGVYNIIYDIGTNQLIIDYTNGMYQHDTWVRITDGQQEYLLTPESTPVVTNTNGGTWTFTLPPELELQYGKEYTITFYQDLHTFQNRNDSSEWWIQPIEEKVYIQALGGAPVVTQASPNSVTFRYDWLAGNTSRDVHYQVFYNENGELVPVNSGAAPYKGTFRGSQQAIDPESNIPYGTWTFEYYLKPDTQYVFAFSEIDSRLGDGSSDELYQFVNTTQGTLSVEEVYTTYDAIEFQYQNNATMNYTVWFELYDTDVNAYESVFEGNVSLAPGTGKIATKYIDEYMIEGHNYELVVYDSITKEDEPVTAEFQYLYDEYIKNFTILEKTATTITIQYEWYSKIKTDEISPYYSTNGGYSWTKVTSSMLVGGGNPNDNGTHILKIQGLEPNQTYSLSFKTKADTITQYDYTEVTTNNSISNVQLETISDSEMKLTFYWDPGTETYKDVWFWFASSVEDYDPYGATNEFNDGYNSWTKLNEPNEYGVVLTPHSKNEITLTGLNVNTPYQIILSTDYTDITSEVTIEGGNRDYDGYYWTGEKTSETSGVDAMSTTTFILLMVSLMLVTSLIAYGIVSVSKRRSKHYVGTKNNKNKKIKF